MIVGSLLNNATREDKNGQATKEVASHDQVTREQTKSWYASYVEVARRGDDRLIRFSEGLNLTSRIPQHQEQFLCSIKVVLVQGQKVLSKIAPQPQGKRA